MAEDIAKQFEGGVQTYMDHLEALSALSGFPAGGTEEEVGPAIDRTKETESAVIALELSVPSDIFHAMRAEASERLRKQSHPRR